MENEFDKKIKEALENFEMPYDASSWASIENQLIEQSATAGGSSSSSAFWKIAAVVGVTLIATATWYALDEEDNISQTAAKVEVNESQTTDATSQISQEQNADTKLSESPIGKKTNSNTHQEASLTEPETADSFTDVDEEILRESSSENLMQTETEELDTEEAAFETTKTEIVTSDKNTNPAIADFIVSATTACVNQEISFINESKGETTKLIWDFGDGVTSVEENPTHSFASPGSYTVTLIAEDNAKKLQITVNPTPNPILSAEQKLNGYQAIPLYAFTTAVQPTETAVWSFSDGIRVSGTEATHLLRDAGNHEVKLTVSNKFGCSASVEEEFHTEKFKLLAPTAFTPSGDGINETFIPKALPEMGIAFEMTIQDPKTGQVVYRTETADEPWDGTLNNSGVELEKGLYVWTVVLKENVSANRVFTETVHLKR